MDLERFEALPWHVRRALIDGLVEEFRTPDEPEVGDGSALAGAGFNVKTVQRGGEQ